MNRYINTNAIPIKENPTRKAWGTSHNCRNCEHCNREQSKPNCRIRPNTPRVSLTGVCPLFTKRTTKHVRYTVYDNATDDVLIVCGTVDECAARLNMDATSFRVAYWRFETTSPAERAELPYYIIREICTW